MSIRKFEWVLFNGKFMPLAQKNVKAVFIQQSENLLRRDEQ